MDYFITLKAVLSAIENNLQSGVDTDALARVAGFSPSHFHTVFRTAMGKPPAAYIRTRRLLHAARDLAESDVRVVDIALKWGFDSHETFTRAFVRQFGRTPSRFRTENRRFSIPTVSPGIFGPTLQYKEETMNEVQKSTERFKDGAVLHGVPKVTYMGNPPELTPFIASLKTALHYVGQDDAPYAHYHCMAGSAFRLMWNTAYWDGGNVDILSMDGDAAKPLRRAIEAAGRSCRLLFKHEVNETNLKGRLKPGNGVEFGGKQEFLSLIRQQIDGGMPVVAFGIIGPPEACVITGYREHGEALLGWNFFQDMPEMAGEVERTDEGYFVRRGWYEHRDTLGVMAIGPCTGMKPLKENVKNALEYAMEVLSPRVVGTYAGGLNAFDAWAGALEKKSEFPANAPAPLLFERLMCQTDAQTEVAEGRSYAHGWLEYMAKQFPKAAEPMEKAAQLFDRSHRAVWEMWDLLGGLGMGEAQAQAIGSEEIRMKLVERIRKCRQYDEQAIPLLKRAAEMLG